MAYHDTEWGRPLHGEEALFAILSLEAFQAGLAWITILRKRDGFRRAFAEWRLAAVAAFDEADVERLMSDTSIVRNQAKIRATIGNAREALELPEGLDAFVWSFALPPRPSRATSFAELPPKTPEAEALSRALKARGFRFVGPTIVYALMQAVGMVDDHLAGCDIRIDRPT